MNPVDPEQLAWHVEIARLLQGLFTMLDRYALDETYHPCPRCGWMLPRGQRHYRPEHPPVPCVDP